jgi:hypothetical protein
VFFYDLHTQMHECPHKCTGTHARTDVHWIYKMSLGEVSFDVWNSCLSDRMIPSDLIILNFLNRRILRHTSGNVHSCLVAACTEHVLLLLSLCAKVLQNCSLSPLSVPLCEPCSVLQRNQKQNLFSSF